MEATVNQFIDFDKRENLPDYRLTIKEYATGAIEFIARRLDPMKMLHAARDHYIPGVGKPLTEAEQEARKEENILRAQRRACGMVRTKIMQMGLDHMLTLTYRENMQDLDKCFADFKRFLRLLRKRYPDWQYVAVPELQKRGAFHLHIACKGRQDVVYIRKCWFIALGGTGNETGENTPGAAHVRYRVRRSGQTDFFSFMQLASYLAKYMSKTFQDFRELGTARYKVARGVPPPRIQKHYLNANYIEHGDRVINEVLREMFDMSFFIGLDNYQLWSNPGCSVIKFSGMKS